MADVTAARHNNLQARIELILGTGAGQSGYGQAVDSYQVSNLEQSNLNIVTADTINSIYTDMVKARIHQVGTSPTEIAEIIANLNTIAETESNFISDSGITSTDPDGTKKGIEDYEDLMSQIEIDKLQVHSSQATVEPGITSSRSSAWNGIIYHEVTLTFGGYVVTDGDGVSSAKNGETHRRAFFNTGGEIRLSGSNANASGSKGRDWQELLADMGTIRFGANSTISTGDGSGQGIGNYQLTTSYQTIYTKVGGGTFSGVYAGNLYTIKAKAPTDGTIMFLIEFNDVVGDGNIDNNVDGTLTSNLQHYRANSVYVEVPQPSYSNTQTLS